MFHCNECDGQFAHQFGCSALDGERERLRERIANWVHPLDAYRAQIEREVRAKCADEIETHEFPEHLYDELFGVGQKAAADLIRPKE